VDIPGFYRPGEGKSSRRPTARLARKLAFSLAKRFPNDGGMTALVDHLMVLPDDVITMGRWSYCDNPPQVHSYPTPVPERIVIGAFCSIAKDVSFILGGNHDGRRVTTSPVHLLFNGEGYEQTGEVSGRGDIIIGNDVWIGRGAMVLSGARIGDGAIVGARAVISGTIAPYAVMVGSPGREIRRRFDDITIARLRASAWWDLPDDVLRDAIDLLSSRDIETFLDFVEPLRRGANPTLAASH
jgi:chloramphenicol O-acetyltransferase type B